MTDGLVEHVPPEDEQQGVQTIEYKTPASHEGKPA